jgi:hypothetical protein
VQWQEIARVVGQLQDGRDLAPPRLELADELKDNTIEALMRKSDAEVGLEALLGREPHQRRRTARS